VSCIKTLTDLAMRLFLSAKSWELYTSHPSLVFDVTWLAAREERILDEHLLNVGCLSECH
jgi:CRP/FNR family transcriptional regulator, anaerobic regulatory protein